MMRVDCSRRQLARESGDVTAAPALVPPAPPWALGASAAILLPLPWVGAMKFQTLLLDIEARAMLEALAGGNDGKVAQSSAMIKVNVPAQSLAKRRVVGQVTLTYRVETSNIVIAAPAAEIEFLMGRVVELEKAYRELLSEDPGTTGTPTSEDIRKAVDLLRVPAWSSYNPKLAHKKLADEVKPPRNIPSDEDYIKGVNEIIQSGTTKLDHWPQWQAHFAMIMRKELGAEKLSDEDWYEMDTDGQDRRRARTKGSDSHSRHP